MNPRTCSHEHPGKNSRICADEAEGRRHDRAQDVCDNRSNDQHTCHGKSEWAHCMESLFKFAAQIETVSENAIDGAGRGKDCHGISDNLCDQHDLLSFLFVSFCFNVCLCYNYRNQKHIFFRYITKNY